MRDAAYYYPSQFVVRVKTPTELPQTGFPKPAFVVKALFAESDILPSNYNKIDSYADGNELTNGIRKA